MYREIVVVDAHSYEITIPEELRGKRIEILAFEIEANKIAPRSSFEKSNYKERTKDLLFSSNGYKFNRNEANEYD
ncbi:MAG: hypothetical protein ACKVOU_15030 [Cytophagales bacterium]